MADEKDPPIFDIQLRRGSSASRVFANGHDITSGIRCVTVSQRAGEHPAVTLELVGFQTKVDVQAAIDDVKAVKTDG